MSTTRSSSLRHLLSHLLLAALISPGLLQAFPDENPTVLFGDGWSAYESGDFQRAVRIWTRLAEQGHVNAQTNLGFMYDYGNGVDRDHGLAAHWYRAAALGGSAAGQYNLALLIAEGHVEPANGHTAQYWLEKAAAQGFGDASQALARTQPGERDSEARPGSRPAHADGATTTLPQTRTNVVEVPVSMGTAWPITAGYAVTNHHIIDGKHQIMLINNRGDELMASVVASDAERDIAFLHVSNPDRLPPALPLSPRSAPLGASVFTIGFPRIDVMGKSPKLSRGIISGANGLRDDPSSYQISVPIQQGNSGGPLINMRGEVVGMITSMLGVAGPTGSAAQAIPSINYALKIDAIRQFLAETSQQREVISALPRTPGDLESLAARIQDSVLIVMAE